MLFRSLQDDDIGNTGPTTLEKAAAEDGAPDAKDRLVKAGYQGGYRRLWATNDFSASLFAIIDRFNSAAGAAEYCARSAESFRSKATSPTSFSVPGLAGAVGLRGVERDGSGTAVFLTKGEWCAEVLLTGTNDADERVQVASVSSLAKVQYRTLP